jgi:hypothetical protein
MYATPGNKPSGALIDHDTVQTLQLHLRESVYNLEKFISRLETWFDDTMGRVSGWYKRQTQTILFFIGIAIAVALNVDTVEIVNKLSVDEDARDKLTQMAIQSLETYKDDPRVKRAETSGTQNDTTEADIAYTQFKVKLDSLVKSGYQEMDEANNLLAFGWDKKPASTTAKPPMTFYERCKKPVGLLLTAIAISLGAPFWFDLLNRLVKLRGTGQKESNGTNSNTSNTQAATVPIVIKTTTGPEAVG